LGDRSFQKKGRGPDPLTSTSDASVDKLLAETAEAVRLGNDPRTQPQAYQKWLSVRPRLLALLAEAEGPTLGFAPGVVRPARDAITNINGYLGKGEGTRQAFSKLKDAEAETPTVDMDEATGQRELNKLEPSLSLWKEAIGKAGSMAGLSQIKELDRAI